MGVDGTRKLAFEVLKRENVETRFIKTSRTASSSYSVVLNFKGEKTILASHLGDVYHLPKFTKPKWLYMSELGEGYELLFHDVAAYIKRTGVTLGFNPGAVQIQEGKRELFELIHRTHVLFVNLEEAQSITKEHTTEIHRLATSLYKMGPKLVVITNGKEGAHVFNGDELYFCDIFPGKVVEATGAGDAFATGFMGALMSGQNHDEALRWGAVNAASVVAFVGPTKGLLSAAKIRYRLRGAPKFKTKKL
jgi:sugar/nucleoside kinase (ribokinase family)